MTHSEFYGARTLLAEERYGRFAREQEAREGSKFAASVAALKRAG